MKRMPTITVAVITLDAAATLPRLLRRLDWADDVVVVDSGSSDGTQDLARRFGARLLARRFDHFSAQRNFALHHARGDWVLFVDADEWPSPALEREIQRRLRATRHDAFRVPIRSTIFGRRFRFSGTQDDRPVRLVRRGWGLWMGEVHERLVCRGASLGHLRHPLEHETLPDLQSFLGKMRRYTLLEAQARVAQGQAPRWHQRYVRPPREVLRRLVYRHGWLDGPEGWAFCGLSGLSEWTLAQTHRQLWRQRHEISYVPQPLEQPAPPLRRAA